MTTPAGVASNSRAAPELGVAIVLMAAFSYAVEGLAGEVIAAEEADALLASAERILEFLMAPE